MLKNELIVLPENEQYLASLVKLTDTTKAFVENSLSLSTRKFYVIDWDIFCKWCEAHKFAPMPASPTIVAYFLSSQTIEGIAHPTLRRRLAAIKRVHESHGLESPTSDKLVKATLAGIKRTSNHIPIKKAPATAERLENILNYCPETIRGLRDKALLLLGFAGAFRRSELVALTLNDIERTPEGIRVTIRKSKTDQEGKGQVIAIPNGTRFRIVDSLFNWLTIANITDGFLFRSISKSGKVNNKGLSDKSVANIIKHYAFHAGFTVNDFSGHSLRAGFLTSAAKSGANIFKMMETSRHKIMQEVMGYVRSENLFENHAGEKFL